MRDGQWRSLLEDPAWVAQEFPGLKEALARPQSRRRVLQLMAASMALAGCDPASTDTKLIPAVVAPTQVIAGLPNFYSTASRAGGDVIGIVVGHQMGRPIKVEGNPNHPASLGATDALAQATILDFYDPDRVGGILKGGQPADRRQLEEMLTALRDRHAGDRGRGLRLLTPTVASPTTGAAIDRVLALYPEARWHQHDPVGRANVQAGAVLAYGRPLVSRPLLANVDVLLALDSDLLSSAPGHVRMARDFAGRRNPVRAAMSRVYAVEPTPTLVGTAGDHRFIAGPTEMAHVIAALSGAADGPAWLAPVLADLHANSGRALVHAGPDLLPEAQAAVFALNERLSGRGHTFDLALPPSHRPAADDMPELLDDMAAGRVDTLVILELNPAYSVPGFIEALPRVATSISMATHAGETALATTWFVPQAHDFETWGDARAYDGTACVLQPQALPLYGGRSPLHLLGLLASPEAVDPLAAVRATWQQDLPSDEGWAHALAEGVIAHTAHPPVAPTLRAPPPLPPLPVAALTALFRPDPHVWDGSGANNAWLQELPRPLTKLVWDNPLLIAPALARQLGLVNGAEATLAVGGVQTTAPVWIVPGQAPDAVVALLGFGRRVSGGVGQGVGVDFYPARAAAGPVTLTPTGRHAEIACTDHHDVLATGPGDIVRHATLAAFTQNPGVLQRPAEAPTLYDRPPGGPVAWGMSIDLNACIGCNACVVACQAENNIPVVGKANVLHSREMHWLRIDRYYEGDADAPQALLQPILCMHCETAPCEVVCPVEATVHDQEGLNLMVYNRCVGTRYCSNNCPYKVRRFNYGPYAQEEQRPPAARNPDVSVRARGVMEKCTFCVQRIADARIRADRDGVPERTVTACQAACPTQAFTFGDLADPAADVVARKRSPLDYALLAERSTKPRVTYEGRITNPNPAVQA